MSCLLAGFACALGGVSLVTTFLYPSVSTFTSIMPNSALALCVLGGAMLLNSFPSAAALQLLAKIGFGLTLLLSGITLAEYGMSQEFGIDSLLTRQSIRIAPLAATCLLLIACAGLLRRGNQRWQIRMWGFATTLAGFLALLALMGYLFEVRPFSDRGGTSIYTALGLLALAASLIFSRPHQGLTAIFFSDTTGGLMARRLLPAALLLPLVIGFSVRLGETAGFYSAASGVSLAAIIFLVSFTALVAWSAHSIYRVDHALQQAQREVEHLNRLLEQKVGERTTALQTINDALQKQISERRAVEAELSRYRDHLEEIVKQRTELLEKANLQLLDEIAQRKQIERKLAEQKERAQVTLASIGDAVITTDAESNVVYLNPVAEALTGWSNAEAKGRPITEIMRLLNEITREPVENAARACLHENACAIASNASLLIRRDGVEIPVSDSAAPIRDRNQTVGVVIVFHDVTKERQLTQQLSYQASHDALTDLANRQEFERRMNRVLKTSKEDNTEHALLFLDLDHFKQVNDTSGHAAGDELLRQIAVLFKKDIRQRDTLARLGGDEFGLLLERCNLSQAETIAQELLAHINAFTFDWNGVIHKLGLSIGIAIIDQNSLNLSTVLSAADAACYESKHTGRNRYSVYTNAMHH
jgi:diguanylate cyclase (GGDEF)-like protein/PAS domain S-box-containing protein